MHTWYTAEVGDTTLKDVLTAPLACSRALLYSSLCKLHVQNSGSVPGFARCERSLRCLKGPHAFPM